MSIRQRFYERTHVRASYKNDLRKLFKELEGQGWRVENRTKHYYAYPPDKDLPQVLISKTPSDSHAWDNMIARLKKSGYQPDASDVEPEETEEGQYATLSGVTGRPDPHQQKDYAAEQAKDQDESMAEFLFEEVARGAEPEEVHEIVDMINDEQMKR